MSRAATNTVEYDYPIPTPEQNELHLRLAVIVMGWVRVTYVDAHQTHGTLKGTPFSFPEREDGRTPYNRSFQSWAPFYDPAAATELRVALRGLGWRCALSEGRETTDDANRWMCRLTPADTAAYVYATGPTPEAALTLAAEQVAVKLDEALL
ncbi:hypothetical protein [Chloroflexus sp.]|uniref:hypothetical protein n=1 Tax=Chloroflexus sp. TaxID=1904827 RepID=UPI002ACEFE5E|nr:hypothetical protein [Chloroflexus sp.]